MDFFEIWGRAGRGASLGGLAATSIFSRLRYNVVGMFYRSLRVILDLLSSPQTLMSVQNMCYFPLFFILALLLVTKDSHITISVPVVHSGEGLS